MKKSIFILLISAIILLSFFHHSSLFSPIYNSDDAVLPLMIHDYCLSQDLYYWGANRGGTLIPLLGRFFYKTLHFSELVSESVTHYLLLIAGFIALSALFKSRLTKIVFAIVWFLPPLRMLELLKMWFGLQYAVIGISIFFMNRLYGGDPEKKIIKRHLFLFLITLCFILSVWISDLALATIVIILAVHLWLFLKKGDFILNKTFLKKAELYYMLSGAIIGCIFIFYAKSQAVKVEDFYIFFDLRTIADAFRIFADSIIRLLLFKINEPFTSIYTYLLAGCVIFLLLHLTKIKYSETQFKWFTIFLLDLALVFLIIMTSKWAYMNGIPRRYFICNYISFWMAFLITVDSMNKSAGRNLLYLILLITVSLGGLGTIYHFKYISPKKLTPSVRIVSEFEQLGKIGIIAEYWNSYLSSVTNPEMIKATPNDKCEVRNQRLVDSVFAQPAIYVIRDMWMDSFPDTLEQFGYVLARNGDEFRIGGCQVCNYKKTRLNKSFDLDKFKYHHAVRYSDEQTGEMMCTSSESDYPGEGYFVYGPYTPIGTGLFSARFYIRVTGITGDKPVALIDVTAEYGTIQLAEKTLDHETVVQDSLFYFNLDFETTRRYSNLEFRIYNYGNANICFHHVLLKEI